MYVPFQLDPNTSELGQTFTAVGRLKPGVTLEQAREQLRISTDGYRAKFPKAIGPKVSFSAEPYKELIINDGGEEGNAETFVIVGAMLMVLLIACVNVANLLLVRAANRRREIGIRIAIGAARPRVIRQLLTECILLSAAGGAVGLLLGDAAMRALILANFTDLPAFWKFEIDWQVMAFALAVCAVTALLFGLLPALAGSRVDLNSTLKDSGGRWGTGLRQNKTRAALVISEVGLAVILLIASSLLVRSFISLHKVDLGFDRANVSVLYTWINGSIFTNTANRAAAIRRGMESIRTVPGVLSASSAAYVPMEGNLGLSFDIAGREGADGSATGDAGWVPVSPGYFEVFKIAIKRGRAFTDRDDGRSPPVAIINEAMAKQYWQNGDPLQDRITIGRRVGSAWEDAQVRQIGGIVGDVRQRGLSTPPDPRIYVPQAQVPDVVMAEVARLAPNAWIIRTQKETRELSAAIQEQLRQATGLPVFAGGSMNQIVASSIEIDRFILIIMTAFASMAVFLATVGVYGVMSYTVQQQTQEIGIRIALGAEASQVRNMVVRRGSGLTLAGVLIGLVAAWELALLMQGMVFGVRPRDPIVFTLAPLVLTIVALLAVWFPATRASRVSPVESLRCE